MSRDIRIDQLANVGHVEGPSGDHRCCCRRPLRGEVARCYGVSQGLGVQLVARYQVEGEAAFEARSRRPHSSPSVTDPDVVDVVIGLRKELEAKGLDAGPHTICWHLTTTTGCARRRPRCRGSPPAPAWSPPSRRNAQELLHPLPGRVPERDLAVRLHPLAPGPPRRPKVEAEILNILDDHPAT